MNTKHPVYPDPDMNETIDRLIRIVARRKWWIFITACATALATTAVLAFIPNHYRSEATLLVVEQQVPQRYVVPTSTTDITEALEAVTQEVLSRTKLLAVIAEFGLYPKERSESVPEHLVDLIRRHIEITPVPGKPDQKSFNAFKISFTAETPQVAQKVTTRLTRLFIEANLRTRAEQAENTTSFLRGQLEDARTRLAAQEQRLREFKMRYLGQLPEQQQGNLAILAGMQTQLQETINGLARARQQRVYLESLLSGYRGLPSRGVPVTAPAANRPPAPLQTAETELARLRADREKLLAVYTVTHPDVSKLDTEISAKEATVARLKASGPKEDAPSKVDDVGSGDRDVSLAQVRSQLEANSVELENLSKDEVRLKKDVQLYQDRLNLTPVREQQLAGMLRDYELIKQDYTDLTGKQLQSQLAASLEKNQEGQQFRLIDPPSLPTVLHTPKRPRINAGAAVGGVLLGLVLAFLVDVRDHSFRKEEEVQEQLNIPLVMAIPLLETPAEQHLRSRRTALGRVAACAMVLAVLVAEFYSYRQG